MTHAYLERIGAGRPAVADAEALRDLQQRHLRTVPFENLSIHLGEEIELTEKALVEKVVTRHRGGFCYEVNGAFAALLGALGFGVRLLAARVFENGDETRPGIPFDHLALWVEPVDGSGPWLADVGFGEFSEGPVLLESREEQRDSAGVFLLREGPHGDLDVFKNGTPQYRLETRPRALADFEGGCWYNRTSPSSHFTRGLVCSRMTGDGRITLSGRTLKRTAAGRQQTEEELPGEAAVLDVYRRHFGIVLDREPVVTRPGTAA
ncbi:N-hydroxyarylamine O-acetyltransferase [Streptomyces aidingensis]|uniref:N-hydroxyarylamine O-acetyltransferase n=2 Tax=Streptomyces aidingensis TaxID=910347 RepID=A0A1I1N2Y6_9ACTN|nr:N-hydroxyarylamine O-acetyltransferase [Streptomyces aidingensis]